MHNAMYYWVVLEESEQINVREYCKSPNDMIVVDEVTGIAYTGTIGGLLRDVCTFLGDR